MPVISITCVDFTAKFGLGGQVRSLYEALHTSKCGIMS
jgi:hypothetical protein